LLEDLARQAEVAVYAVRLTADLQRSRERLVATREEERRRLRRDLHDGLGAQLAGLNVQAGTLRRLIPRDPAAADELVVELRDELRGAIADIRRLVYDLRPQPSTIWGSQRPYAASPSATAQKVSTCAWWWRPLKPFPTSRQPSKWPSTASPRRR
jgi:signal transduction histidine kinase